MCAQVQFVPLKSLLSSTYVYIYIFVFKKVQFLEEEVDMFGKEITFQE